MKASRGAGFSLLTAALCLSGCYNFVATRREIRTNDDETRALTNAIQKEIERKDEMQRRSK